MWKRKEKEKYLLKLFSNLWNKKTKRIGYQITIGKNEEINGIPTLYSETLFHYVRNNLIDIDDKEEYNKLKQNKKPEVFVDFNDNIYKKIKININYNKTLSFKRKSLEREKSNNVLFLFIDNLSRVHFYRQFKKTR